LEVACVGEEREPVSPAWEDPAPLVVPAIEVEEPEGCAAVRDEPLASDEVLDSVVDFVVDTDGIVSEGSKAVYLF
jgi:hypothetical protein